MIFQGFSSWNGGVGIPWCCNAFNLDVLWYTDTSSYYVYIRWPTGTRTLLDMIVSNYDDDNFYVY